MGNNVPSSFKMVILACAGISVIDGSDVESDTLDVSVSSRSKKTSSMTTIWTSCCCILLVEGVKVIVQSIMAKKSLSSTPPLPLIAAEKQQTYWLENFY
jgi:hypothetical protein